MFYIIEKYRRTDASPRTACFAVAEDGEHDLVSLDHDEPNWQPSVVTVNSHGEVTKVTWNAYG